MAITITKPDGEKVKIDGDKVCFDASPQVCRNEHPEILQLMTEYAWHQGWKVDFEAKAG